MSAMHQTKEWKSTRAIVLRRDQWRCTKSGCRSQRQLEVHHHDRSPERFHDPDACRVLCRNHHLQESRREWKARRTTGPGRDAWDRLISKRITA